MIVYKKRGDLMAKVKSSNKTSKSRPIGATIVSIYYYIIGILGLIASIMVLTVGSTIIEMFAKGPLFKLIGAAVGVFLIILSIVYIIVGYGLWKMKKWAQIVATILSVLGLFGGPVSLIISIIVILLLCAHKKTRLAFS